MGINKGIIFKEYINSGNGCRIWESVKEQETELVRVDSKDLGFAREISELAKQLGFPREFWYEYSNNVSMVFDVGTYKKEIIREL